MHGSRMRGEGRRGAVAFDKRLVGLTGTFPLFLRLVQVGRLLGADGRDVGEIRDRVVSAGEFEGEVQIGPIKKDTDSQQQ